MPCNLTLIGKNLDIDTFVKKSKLRGYLKSYKGQPRFKSKPEGEKLPYSLLKIQTSKADFDNLVKQIKETIKYLKRNKEKLSHILVTPEIEYAILDFGIDLTIDRKKTLTQSSLFPNDLLKLAGDLGLDIELSIYPINLQTILEKRSKKS